MSDDKNQVVSTYMSISDASKNWAIPKHRIVKLCEDCLIDGVAKLGDDWIIPTDAQKPEIIINTTLSRPVKATTAVQKVALDHIEKGENFHTREIEIDGRIFIVSSVFPKQGCTPEEVFVSYLVSQLEKFDGLRLSASDHNDLMKEIRAISSANSNTLEKYIEHYRKLFKEYGFSDEDIEVLLERKSQDYEDFIL